MPSPTATINGRKTAKTAFPVEMVWLSLNPMIVKIKK
jgi:hypothetical protein